MPHVKYLNVVLTALTLVLTLNLAVQLSDSPISLVSEAHAAKAEARGVGSQAERQQAILNELEALSASVEKINTTLTSGDLRVKMDATPGSEK